MGAVRPLHQRDQIGMKRRGVARATQEAGIERLHSVCSIIGDVDAERRRLDQQRACVLGIGSLGEQPFALQDLDQIGNHNLIHPGVRDHARRGDRLELVQIDQAGHERNCPGVTAKFLRRRPCIRCSSLEDLQSMKPGLSSARRKPFLRCVGCHMAKPSSAGRKNSKHAY